MDYTKLAINELEQYSLLCTACENCKSSIVEIEEKMLRLQGGDTEKIHIRSGFIGEERLCALIDEKQERIWQLSSLTMRLKRFERAFAALTKEEQRVLDLCFINRGETTEEIAWQLGVEKSCLYKKRNRALENFKKALFGAVDA